MISEISKYGIILSIVIFLWLTQYGDPGEFESWLALGSVLVFVVSILVFILTST